MNEELNYPVEDDKVILTDEDGQEVEFEFLASIMYDGNEYVVLLPEDDNQVVILQVMEQGNDDEDTIYASVEDQEVLQKVFDLFQEQCKDEFEFVDP